MRSLLSRSSRTPHRSAPIGSSVALAACEHNARWRAGHAYRTASERSADAIVAARRAEARRQGRSIALLRVQNDRDRPVVDELELHACAEDTHLHVNALRL